MIHPTAVIDPEAELADGVTVGPYSIIHAGVSIGENTAIGSHTVINGPSSIGQNNKIFHFCSIGEDPQDKKYAGENESILKIGDGNVIREYCSINRGTADGGGETVLGNDNWIMAYVHIAHDCIVGDNVIFANNTTLAGHVTIDDYVILGGFTGVHQFCHIGAHSFSAISSVIVKDVPPYLMVTGNTAKPCGLNREGLKRRNFDADEINGLRRAYKILYREGNTLQEATEKLRPLAEEQESIATFLTYIEESSRGIVR